MKVNIFLTNVRCSAKLQLVKSIKNFSEPTMGLKEAKWLVDDLFDNVGICSFSIKNGSFNEFQQILNSINIGVKSSREDKLKRILDPRDEKNIRKNKNTLHFIFDELTISEDGEQTRFLFERDFEHFIEKYNNSDGFDNWEYLASQLMSRSFVTLLKIFKPYMVKNDISIDEFIRNVNRELRNDKQ